ncbi:Y-family DNA polymerase [Kushneria indalinina]|uniref:DNA polymerase V n=1 Tax=Kushneria indalinina DSM 14324 TaxID=1122140 RepID=A0A3D9DRX8_9GAMM|nr:Y-family DNA polymerase [Kushneria indalinina]REC93395.1 DNA polymerase V [Kushneria indalinina DSM 14324]
MIGIVDCNSFYVSCERLFRPDLNDRPVGVLSNNDGCVIALSNELKALGITMGTPAHFLRDQVMHEGVTLFSSNYELYGDISQRVQAVLEEFSAGIDPYSIDECWVDFSGFSADQLEQHAHELRRRVKQYTGIPVSIGVAPTRTLAKVANRAAKKNASYEGVCVLYPNSPRAVELLQHFDLGDIWGIGRRLDEKLRQLGINTAWDLRRQNAKELRRRFSVTLERTVLELQETPAIEMMGMDFARERIMTSRSFGQLTEDKSEVRGAIRQHAQRSAEKLRKQGSLCRAVLVFLRTNPHRHDLDQYNPSQIIELDHATDDSRDIVAASMRVLERIYTTGFQYKKAGVMLMDIGDRSVEQLSLLDSARSDIERARSGRLMGVMDELNEKMGRNTVRLGSAATGAAWQLRCANRSPRFTTRWDEIPMAKL